MQTSKQTRRSWLIVPFSRDDSFIFAGRIVTPSKGVNNTATIHDTINDTAITTNKVKVNSPALLLLSPMG